VIIFLLVNCI